MEEIMTKDNWKARLADEYHQVKARYEKLRVWNDKVEIKVRLGLEADRVSLTYQEGRKRDVDRVLLMGQQRAMGEYLHILELRAVA